VDYTIDRKKRKAVSGGLWRVRSHDAFHKAGRGSRIILCDKVRDFKRLSLSTSDAQRLGKSVFEYASANHFKTDRNGNMLEMPFDKVATLLEQDGSV